jgi:hypothetical protein
VDDVQLNFENADEIFDCSQSATKFNHEDGGIECLLMDKNIPVTKCSSLIGAAVEVTGYNTIFLEFNFYTLSV